LKSIKVFGIIIVLISIIYPLGAGADEVACYKAFSKASNQYSESLFEDAVKTYEGILDSGYHSANLYYNLGNAYFKLGSLGKAIVNYERAKKLMPNDGDLKSNLEYAYSLVQEPAMDRNRIWFSRRIKGFLDSMTIDGITKVLSFIFLIIIALLIVMIFNKGLKTMLIRAIVVLLILLMFFATWLGANIYKAEDLVSAIVLKKEANARFEPVEGATVHFKLYEGMNIRILKTRGVWSQIKREDGKVGWLEDSAFELI